MSVLVSSNSVDGSLRTFYQSSIILPYRTNVSHAFLMRNNFFSQRDPNSLNCHFLCFVIFMLTNDGFQGYPKY